MSSGPARAMFGTLQPVAIRPHRLEACPFLAGPVVLSMETLHADASPACGCAQHDRVLVLNPHTPSAQGKQGKPLLDGIAVAQQCYIVLITAATQNTEYAAIFLHHWSYTNQSLAAVTGVWAMHIRACSSKTARSCFNCWSTPVTGSHAASYAAGNQFS